MVSTRQLAITMSVPKPALEGYCLALNWLTDSGLLFDETASEQVKYTLINGGQLARRFTVFVEGLHIGACCD
jgi:hypothetical protein